MAALSLLVVHKLKALRNLKKAGVSCADIVTVYCVMIRTVLEYASVVFANLPQTLSNDLERVERRAWRLFIRLTRTDVPGDYLSDFVHRCFIASWYTTS